jgi:hypothetical protein
LKSLCGGGFTRVNSSVLSTPCYFENRNFLAVTGTPAHQPAHPHCQRIRRGTKPPARVSKTFLYDPKHSDLAEQIRSLRQSNPQSSASTRTNSNKSDSAKDAQIARFKERVRRLEEQVRSLKEENELLYGKLTNCK